MNQERMEEDRLLMESMLTKGLCCAQILVKMVLDRMGEENEQMLRAVSALCGGIKTRHNCGALTGAAMGLALLDERLSKIAVPELVRAFENAFGSVECAELIGENGERRAEICPGLIQDTYFIAMEIAEQYGISI